MNNHINLLIVGGISTGKSATVNALLDGNFAYINEDNTPNVTEIKKYKSGLISVWDTPGFGNSIEDDIVLSEQIIRFIREKDENGVPLINVILLVADASTRDMGTEYAIISKVIKPNLLPSQRFCIGMNQCDFAMKGKHWDEIKKAPDNVLHDFLKSKAISVKERLKESVNVDIEPVYYSAIYGYNIETLKSLITGSESRMEQKGTTIDRVSTEEDYCENAILTENVPREAEANHIPSVRNNKALQTDEDLLLNDKPKTANISEGKSIEGNMSDVYAAIKEQIVSSTLSAEDQKILLDRLATLREKKLNIMIVGGTGVGKSSTINALFGKQVAKVGEGTEPQTSIIEKFILGKITIWDTPGLGDSPESDKLYANKIIEMLQKKDANGGALIDVVLVVLDASVSDMGTAYKLIKDVVIPHIGDVRRILVALNQCDFAMKGKYWDHNTNSPKERLDTFLQDKIAVVQTHIKESTGLTINPIYYSALYHYNISKLFFYLLDSTPDEKRIMYLNQMNQDIRVWDNDDGQLDYGKKIEREIGTSTKKIYENLFDGFATDVIKCFEDFIYHIGKSVHTAIQNLFGLKRR